MTIFSLNQGPITSTAATRASIPEEASGESTEDTSLASEKCGGSDGDEDEDEDGDKSTIFEHENGDNGNSGGEN